MESGESHIPRSHEELQILDNSVRNVPTFCPQPNDTRVSIAELIKLQESQLYVALEVCLLLEAFDAEIADWAWLLVKNPVGICKKWRNMKFLRSVVAMLMLAISSYMFKIYLMSIG